MKSTSQHLEAFVRKTPTFWATAVAVALALPAFAQEPAKDHVKELIAQAMQQAGQTAPAAPAVQALPEAGPRTPLSADEAVRRALEITPPELASDIVDRGIVMTGGGALIRGLDVLLQQETGLPIHQDEDPMTCVVRGTGRILDEPEKYRNVLTT